VNAIKKLMTYYSKTDSTVYTVAIGKFLL